MSVRSISQTIKDARIRSGLSQRQLSEGICSTIALSNIENGKYGVSPSNFSLLMSKMGIHCEEYPIFKNQTDYECFRHLENATSYLSYCKLDLVHSELEQLQIKSFSNNMFYYQKWLYLYAHFLIIDKRHNADVILTQLKSSFQLTQSVFDLSTLTPKNYTSTEKSLLLFYAFFAMDRKKDYSLCSSILTQLKAHCSTEQNTVFLFNFVQCYYYFETKQFDEAYRYAKEIQQQSLSYGNYTFIIFAVFVIGLTLLKKEASVQAATYFNAAIDSAIIYSPLLAKTLISYVDSHLPELELKPSFDIPSITFPHLLSLDFPENLDDGSFSIYNKEVINIGDLILYLRTTQKISQQKLCQGLCSKSTLSKLEQGKALPNIFVSMGLLERLGLSSREFHFYGSQQEASFYRIIKTISKHYHMDKKEYSSYVDELNVLADNDPLLTQYCYLFKTQLTTDQDTIIDICKTALNISFPNFDLLKLTQYRFSWVEMTFINILVNAIAFSDNYLDAPFYYQQIYQYSTDNNFELLWKKNYLSVALTKYIRFLGEKKMYSILLARFEQWDFSCCFFHLDSLLDIYYYLSLSHHSLGDIDTALKFKSMATSLAITLNNTHAQELIEIDLNFTN